MTRTFHDQPFSRHEVDVEADLEEAASNAESFKKDARDLIEKMLDEESAKPDPDWEGLMERVKEALEGPRGRACTRGESTPKRPWYRSVF